MLNPDQLHDQLSSLAQSHGLSRWDMGASCSTDLSVQVDRGKAHQLKGRNAVLSPFGCGTAMAVLASPAARISQLMALPKHSLVRLRPVPLVICKIHRISRHAQQKPSIP